MPGVREQLGAAIRSVPGGATVLAKRIHVARRVRRVVRPRRPPEGSTEVVRRLDATPETDDFITGNGFAAHCRYVLNHDVFHVNEDVDNDWWFCKADYLEYFFRRHSPPGPYVLVTHNSDRLIDRSFRRRLDRPGLVAWFAQNPVVRHPKLRAIPIGIANPRWPHGDQEALRRIQCEHLPKSLLFDVGFNVETYPPERLYCLEQTGLEVSPRLPFPEYLERLASSYFCISPRGNGVDCLRTWEALYLRTIPVVTRSLVTDHHRDIPAVVLDDWSEFRSIDFTPDLYERIWGDWSPYELRLDRYVPRMEAAVAALRAY